MLHRHDAGRVVTATRRASWPLLATTVAVMAVSASLPFSPLGPYLGFVPLPVAFWPILAGILLGYVALTQAVKTWLLRKGWLNG